MEKLTDVARRRSKISVDGNFIFFYPKLKLRDISKIHLFVKFHEIIIKNYKECLNTKKSLNKHEEIMRRLSRISVDGNVVFLYSKLKLRDISNINLFENFFKIMSK